MGRFGFFHQKVVLKDPVRSEANRGQCTHVLKVAFDFGLYAFPRLCNGWKIRIVYAVGPGIGRGS